MILSHGAGNKQAHRSKIPEAKFRKIIRLFSVDLDAGQIAEIAYINRDTVNRCFSASRMRIAEYCETTSHVQGEIEVGESRCGAHRATPERMRIPIQPQEHGRLSFATYHHQGKSTVPVKTSQDTLKKRRGPANEGARTSLYNANLGASFRREASQADGVS
jgi:hypothetical protein